MIKKLLLGLATWKYNWVRDYPGQHRPRPIYVEDGQWRTVQKNSDRTWYD
jgi:hypothetical protein